MREEYLKYRIEERLNRNDVKKYIPMFGIQVLKSVGLVIRWHLECPVLY